MATMFLKDKFDKGLIHIGDYILAFQPDYAEYTLQPEETGWKEKQILHTEADMKWQLACIDGQLALLADANTKGVIWLKGGRGYENGPMAISRYVLKCWSSKKFHSNGFFITKEQFEQLPRMLQRGEGAYWLASHYQFPYFITAIMKVPKEEQCCVEIGCVRGADLLYSDIGYYYGVRPAVMLPSHIRIDQGNNLLPFDDTEEEKMLFQRYDAKKQLEVMIAEQEEKLAQQQKQFSECVYEQKEMLKK